MAQAKKFLLPAVLFVLVFFLLPGAAMARPRIAILEFEDKSGSGAPGEAVADMLTTELFSTNEFTILERSRLDAVLAEQNLGSAGYVDPGTAVRLGKLLGVQFLITGAVTRFKTETGGAVVPLPIGGFSGVAVGSHTAHVSLDVRAISVQTGEIVLAAREDGAANATVGAAAVHGVAFGGGKTGGILASATYQAVTKIVPRFAALKDVKEESEPVQETSWNIIEGGKASVAVDAGAGSGIRVGQYLAAYREGKALKDRQCNVLDTEKIYTGVLVVREVKPKYSRCQVVRAPKPLLRGEKVEIIQGPPESVPLSK